MSTEEHISKLVDSLSELSVLDMSKLKEALEDKWGVKAAAGAPMMMAAPAAQEGGAEAAAESTEFQVTLEEAPADKKISIIKEVRQITSLGLKEAKELVESAPKPLKDSCSKDESEEIKKKIEAAGGKVAIKGL